LGPNESRTLSLWIPQRAHPFRLLMYYEHGPLWSKVDQFFKDHGINVPVKLLTLGWKVEERLPGHYKRLTIEVDIPPPTRKFDENNAAHPPG
jgi:hypothetical protein